MRVVERYFGPLRKPEEGFFGSDGEYEGYLKVEVDGRYLHAKSRFSAEMVRYSRIPEHVLMRKLEDEIMYEIRKELFGR